MPETTTTTHPALSLLRRAHASEHAATIFQEKVLRKPLILRPTSPDSDSKDARAARRRQRLRKKEHQLRRRKPRPLSAKERRKLGVHDIPTDPSLRRWELYVPLRRLWWAYMRDLLGIEVDENDQANRTGLRFLTGMSVGPKLASADYHGAELKVVRSNCVSRVGLQGIVLKDTKFTFEVVTRQNEVKTIPKAHTIFEFQVPRTAEDPPEPSKKALEDVGNPVGAKPFVFELHGSQFEIRPADRANKKFKPRRMDDL